MTLSNYLMKVRCLIGADMDLDRLEFLSTLSATLLILDLLGV